MRPHQRLATVVLGAVLVAVVGCQPAGPSSTAGSPTAIDTPLPSPTGAAPDRTPVPGFADWQTINPQGVRISVDGDALVLDLIGGLLWLNDQRGVLFYRDVTGDFRATATVRTSKASDPSLDPGGDGTVQLAGLMARTEVPAENNVFIVSGSIGTSTGLETKTTTNSQSIWVQRGLPTGGDAELKVCRIGFTFLMLWRHVDSNEGWTRMSTFERHDMPDTVQVGAAIYTNATPDIVARFEHLKIEALPTGAQC